MRVKRKGRRSFDVLEELKPKIYFDYEDINLLEKITLAQMLKDWLNEVTENDIIERYGTTPGQLQEIINKAIWINHCTQELIKTTRKA